MGYLDEYDGIILGAGHNGLIAQAYLARAGFSVLSIDRAQHAGGGLQTAEDNSLPGFLHATHAVSFRGITETPWYRDLGLADWDVRLLEPDPNIVSHLRDGTAICWHLDPQRTSASIARLSEHDAHAWLTVASEYGELVREIVGPELQSVPISDDERARLLAGSALGRTYLELLELSPWQFIEQTFEHPAVRAMLLYFCIVREIDVNVTGQGHLIPSFIATKRPGQIVQGGSYALARGLKQEVWANGGHIMEQAVPRRIIVENGRAAGVELASGRVVRAREFVASALNPQQTFLELLGNGDVGAEVRSKAEGYRYQEVGQIFGVNVALRNPPDYVSARTTPEVATGWLTFLGLDDHEPILDLYNRAPEGRLAEQIMLIGACPTLHDPTQAPPGGHAAYMWQKVPYALDGDPLNWDARKSQQMEAIIDFWNGYAPNLRDDMLNAFAGSPLDTERKFPSMARGDLFHGWHGPGQRGVDRPFPGGRPYRAIEPDRLYLCGSSVHPGGNIGGLPGYIAASQIMSDLGAKPWWKPRDVWAELRETGLVKG